MEIRNHDSQRNILQERDLDQPMVDGIAGALDDILIFVLILNLQRGSY